jgi:4-hydroxy-3-polyprenylbenzoate decarboxylase
MSGDEENNANIEERRVQLDRRQLMALTAGLAGASASSVALAQDGGLDGLSERAPKLASKFPHSDFREWMKDLERRGLVMRIKRLDQDAFEMTALAYRLMDCFGMYEAPAVIAEEVKIDGQWVKGPVVFNHQGHWDTEALAFGLEPVPGHGTETYRNVIAHITGVLADNGGKLPLIPPVEIEPRRAPVKQVVVTGDDIDITKFAFITSNPGDSGRYVNTGSVFTDDVDLGKNFGTYRCQIKGPKKLGVNPEPGQGAWKAFMKKKERGEKSTPIAIVLGQDPMTWIISGSSVSKDGTDELSISGGLRGQALETVKCETSDLRVPANAEMVIEGVVPLDAPMEPEGPFGEMYGYLGLKKSENFFMEITAITHRRNPWILNQFTGVTRGFCTAPLEAIAFARLKRFVPNAIAFHSPVEATGLTFISINKEEPGQALKIGRNLARIVPIAKVVVVVDADIDVYNRTQVMFAMGSRWQPYPATEIIESARGMPLDPSSPDRPNSSKIIVDATRQWPEEGGPDEYPPMNRRLLEDLAPESFERVDGFFYDLYRDYIRRRQI